MDFRSDNTLGCSPEIAEALARAGSGALSPYGNDEITARVKERCRDLFETDVEILPVLTGTGGNSLAIATMTPPWGAVFCHEDAHVQRDELGAPEFFTEGAKMIPVAGTHGKIAPADLERSIHDIGDTRRMAIPSCLSLTNATEAGTVYSADETRALCDVAKQFRMGVHLDGARFANAVVKAGCSPADLTWRAGVDILIFGGTKNGAMAAELMVVFKPEMMEELRFRWHRSGHRLSKMRFLSSQFDAYLENDLWLRNARNANALAARLREGLETIEGIEILRPVDANILLVRLAPHILSSLREQGFLFYDWEIFGPGAVRLVTGFSTRTEEVDALLAAARNAAVVGKS
jgi:threonine aldolase